MNLPHTNEVMLDYNCGYGNDVAKFYARSVAKQSVGMDVSSGAMFNTCIHMELHRAVPERLRLIQVDDTNSILSLPTTPWIL